MVAVVEVAVAPYRAAAVGIAFQRAARRKVGARHHHQVGLGWVAAGEEVGEGVEAACGCGGGRDAPVHAWGKGSVAVRVAVQLDDHAVHSGLGCVQRATVVGVVPHPVAQGELLHQAKVNRRVVGGSGVVVHRVVAQRTGVSCRRCDRVGAQRSRRRPGDPVVVVVHVVGGVGRGGDVGAAGVGSGGHDLDQVSRAGDEGGEGVEAVGVGGGAQQQGAAQVVEAHDDAACPGLAGVKDAVVVVVVPHLVAQGELVEAKVEGQVRVGVSVTIGVSGIRWFITTRHRYRCAGDKAAAAQCAGGQAVVVVVEVAVAPYCAAAVGIVFQRATRCKVGARHHHQVGQRGCQAGIKARKGIVTRAGRRSC